MREERAQIGEHRSSIAPLVGRSHRADERRDRPDGEIARCDRAVRSRGAIDEIASLVGAGFGLMRSHCLSSLVDEIARRLDDRIARRPDDRIAPI